MNSDLFKNKFRISSSRLVNWDYSQSGYYFVTICVKNRQCLLGEIRNRKIYLSNYGKIIKQCFIDLSNHFNNIRIDEFIVMPNHVHGIIIIKSNPNCRDVINHVSTIQNISPMNKISLGKIIRYFKGKSTFLIHQFGNNTFQWQPRYYDHIIRAENDLLKTQQYIRWNALKWEDDEENPINIKSA